MMAWSDERVAILKKMWLEGNSASEIAKVLGNITSVSYTHLRAHETPEPRGMRRGG